jgi:hypothetical protein
MPTTRPQSIWTVVTASSLGTVFEWYDFYLYGSLAVDDRRSSSRRVDETPAFIFALLAFAAGFSCGRSARWSSVGSATSSAASTRSSSPS